MTEQQAQGIGAQVRRGEKRTLVQFWKLTDQVAAKDERGRPLKDADGNPVYRKVQLDKPKVFSAVVFNAEQVEGLPALEVKTPASDRHERAEAILKASGVEIRHDQADPSRLLYVLTEFANSLWTNQKKTEYLRKYAAAKALGRIRLGIRRLL